MKVTYIDHSGFLLETDTASLLFDFVKGALPALPAKKPLYVFVSHIHGDHYDRRIFTAVAGAAKKAGVPLLSYVLSSDIPARDVPGALREQTVFLSPHEVWSDNTLRVETLASNDEGVAFVISGKDAASFQIYYAGDLNAWNWDGDAEDMELIRIYHEELARIAGRTFDIAFIPLDPRLGEEYTQGITDFFDVCGCDALTVVPMHCWGKYEIIPKAKKKLADTRIAERIAVYSKPGITD